MPIQLVVFDWAGTVIDFGCQAPTGAFVQALGECGVTISLREARGPMGLHKKDHLRALLNEPSIGHRWNAAHGRAWTEADVDALYQRVTPLQVTAAKQYSQLVPGVLECLAELRGMGVKIAGTTGYFREAADVVYAAAAQQGYAPDYCICADEVPAGRPAPWMIFRAMEALNVYPPSAVVKVGDTLVDIADGLNAGVWSLGVIDSSNEMGLSKEELGKLGADELQHRRDGIRKAYLAAGAHGVLNTLAELPGWIASSIPSPR
jgi:phosphonoacetaldehyde hydrolase